MLARVGSTQRTLLSPITLEHGRIQVQTVSRRTLRKPFELPTPQAREKALARPLPKTLEQIANGVVDGSARSLSNACKATSARSKLVCAKRRAPATTERKKAVKVSTGSMALGEVRRNGRCLLTEGDGLPH
jgi:hypothetical protein